MDCIRQRQQWPGFSLVRAGLSRLAWLTGFVRGERNKGVAMNDVSWNS